MASQRAVLPRKVSKQRRPVPGVAAPSRWGRGGVAGPRFRGRPWSWGRGRGEEGSRSEGRSEPAWAGESQGQVLGTAVPLTCQAAREARRPGSGRVEADLALPTWRPCPRAGQPQPLGPASTSSWSALPGGTQRAGPMLGAALPGSRARPWWGAGLCGPGRRLTGPAWKGVLCWDGASWQMGGPAGAGGRDHAKWTSRTRSEWAACGPRSGPAPGRGRRWSGAELTESWPGGGAPGRPGGCPRQQAWVPGVPRTPSALMV